jgi:hypothetical protein
VGLQAAAAQLRQATAHSVEKQLAVDSRRRRRSQGPDGSWLGTTGSSSPGTASQGEGSQRSADLEELFSLMAALPRPESGTQGSDGSGGGGDGDGGGSAAGGNGSGSGSSSAPGV